MTRVLAKGNFSSVSDTVCIGESVHIPLVKEFNSSISAKYKLDYTITSQIVLDVGALDINWLPGEQYSFVLSPGFCSDRDTGQENLEISIPYTSNTSPIVESTVPESGSTNIINNRSVALVFSRKVTLQTGFIKLYEDSPTPVLLHTFDVTNPSEVTLVDNILTINVLGYLKSNTKYYILVDGSIVKDADGLFSNSVTSPNSITYTTAPYELFPELEATFSTQTSSISIGKVVSYADRFLSPPDYDFNYLEDMTNYLIGAPRIVDPQYDGSGTYTLKLTPSTPSAIETWGSTNAYPYGGLYSWTSTNNILTITGTRDQVNATMDGLYFVGGTDFASDFTITFFAKTPRNDTATKVQNIKITTPYDTEITNMIGVNRNYTGNTGNSIFATNTPYISDFDTTAGITYTIKLTSLDSGQFSSLTNATDLTTTWSFTGTKDQCNAKFPSIKYYPVTGVSSNSSFLYQQYKNSVLQLSININLIGSGSLYDYTQQLIFTESGSWSPTYEQVKYANIDLLIVAGGGGGGSADSNQGSGSGGGGGGVKEIFKPTFSLQSYPITVGLGGAGCVYSDLFQGNNPSPSYDSSTGGNGGSSSAFGYTVTGGRGAHAVKSYPNVTTTGGTSGSLVGNATFAGGTGRWAGTGSIYGGGGGGAGAIGTDYVQGTGDYSTYKFGGNGGSGVLSTITGQYYGGGGGGASYYDIVSSGTRYIGLGGAGGGGNGGGGWYNENRKAGYDASPNSGGGGGGGKTIEPFSGTVGEMETRPVGGRGADGIVIIKVSNK